MSSRFHSKTPAMLRPANPQPRSLFFRLPPEIRIMIYKLAFPRIEKSQLVYRHNDSMSRRDFWSQPAGLLEPPAWKQVGSLGRTARQAVDTKEEDDFNFRYRYSYCYHNPRPRDDSPYQSYEMTHFNFQPTEIDPFPLSLLQTCRRMYQDVALFCDKSLAFVDLNTLDVFLDSFTMDLLGRIQTLSVDINPYHRLYTAEDCKTRLLRNWKTTCQKLTTLGLLSLRVKIKISSPELRARSKLVPLMLRRLDALVDKVPDVEVELIMWGHEKWIVRPAAIDEERTRLDEGLTLPRWRTRAKIPIMAESNRRNHG